LTLGLPKNNRLRIGTVIETILHIVLKLQFDRACFQSADFGKKRNKKKKERTEHPQ